MSFVYARKLKNKFYILADSKTTISDDDSDRLKIRIGEKVYNDLKKFGVIKNVIINENICIASAGVLEDFNELLKYVDTQKINDINLISHQALNIHLHNNKRTDFIIAKIDTNKELLEIKNGIISKVETSWLGSYNCFNIFQNIRHDKLFRNQIEDSYSVLIEEDKNRINYNEFPPITIDDIEKDIDFKAFDKAVKSNTDLTVGGYIVECIEHHNKFMYPECINSTVEKPQIVPSDGEINTYNEASEGGYTYHAYESNNNFKLYIYQMKKGIIYEPNINDPKYNHLRLPKIYNMKLDDFIKNNNIKQSITINIEYE